MSDLYLLWEACQHQRISQVAKENGYTTQGLLSEFRQAGLTGREPADPSPDEIRAAAERFRKSWSPQVEEARWIGRHR